MYTNSKLRLKFIFFCKPLHVNTFTNTPTADDCKSSRGWTKKNVTLFTNPNRITSDLFVPWPPINISCHSFRSLNFESLRFDPCLQHIQVAWLFCYMSVRDIRDTLGVAFRLISSVAGERWKGAKIWTSEVYSRLCSIFSHPRGRRLLIWLQLSN